ncbi:ATP synthase F0F1 subunit B [Paenibacillus swuensis]|uniref:ATP synthase subunit b n=1 Tax=Paenibacillus swuensis TaxID=1178515 RepID=A0A172TIP8_9BACL|nr:F0F1 ATP synthase subunit B [Paenibacillus swuensis]ANE46663.1 ATP synthase F0F1 subunit B [Paenibacillus swuensis]
MTIVWESSLIAIVSFAILYFLLHKYAFGPLFSIMEKRREHVLGEMQEAEKNRAESAKLMEEQKAAIQEARKEAYGIIEQSRATSTKQADEIIRTAKEEAAKLKDDAVKDIDSEKNKAIAALRGEVGGLSVKIASKILEKQVDEKAQEQLVDQYLNKVGGNV